jgi:hypothetical protein
LRTCRGQGARIVADGPAKHIHRLWSGSSPKIFKFSGNEVVYRSAFDFVASGHREIGGLERITNLTSPNTTRVHNHEPHIAFASRSKESFNHHIISKVRSVDNHDRRVAKEVGGTGLYQCAEGFITGDVNVTTLNLRVLDSCMRHHGCNNPLGLEIIRTVREHRPRGRYLCCRGTR